MKVIGTGRHSTVFSTKDGICVKQVPMTGMCRKSITRELLALKMLSDNKSDNVVKFLGVETVSNEFVNIKLELMDLSLDELILSADDRFAEETIQLISRQIVQGLQQCHSLGIIHRDIKPGNVLISRSLDKVKLADFGIARRMITSYDKNITYECTNEICTRWYKPIEILFGDPNHSTKIDIWSLGCVIAELFLLNPLFQGWSDIEQLYLIQNRLGEARESDWPGVSCLPDFGKMVFDLPMNIDRKVELEKLMPQTSAAGIEFILNCLVYDPRARCCAEQCLHSPWLLHTDRE